MKTFSKALNSYFKPPTATEVATDELASATLNLLEAQSALEYSSAMVEYNSKRVSRLTMLVSAQTNN